MRPPSLSQWSGGGKLFTHRGHAVFYRESGRGGAGAALVCIHGFPTASWDWHRLWPALCRAFAQVYAPDMIGFGLSAKPTAYAYSIFDQATLHEELLRERGVTRVHILAHDYGDTVAQELLARHEERLARGDRSLVVESCVFLNGGLFPEVHRARLVQKLLASPLGPLVARLMNERSFRRSFAAIFGPRTRPSREELREFWSLIAHNDGRLVFPKLIGYMAERRAHRERWVGVLQKTTVPLHLIDGPQDPVSGAHMVARYRELVPKPDVVVLPGIGHYPQVEDPAGVETAFFEFHGRIRT
ncbi:MAG: alpha/beta hydrolase [Gammaproteobacteria bacterium]|nr:alpha/beta hydrolase [Gammaproteobacteria bacterium]